MTIASEAVHIHRCTCLQIKDGIATCGITNHAQEQLGDLVYVSLPEAGAEVGQGDSVSVLESVKAATEMYAPVSGTVIEVNAVSA